MKLNKKSLVSELILPLFLFFFVVSIFTFFLMFAQEGFGDEMINEVTEQVNIVATKVMDNPNAVINNSNTLKADYQEAQFNYDWLFLLAFLVLQLSLIELALNSPKLPAWNYLSWLFFGSVMLVFAFSWIMDASSWFINNFIFGGMFDPAAIYMPFYNWFIEFQIVIWIIDFVGVLVINQLFGKSGIIDTSALLGGSR